MTLDKELKDDILSRANVVALGHTQQRVKGQKTGKRVLTAFVREKKPESELEEKDIVPKELNGEKTDVQEIGQLTIEPEYSVTPGQVETETKDIVTKDRHRPFPQGSSIGHKDITAGTAGRIMFERVEEEIAGETVVYPKPVGTSNNHVVANENKGEIGDMILQPGCFDSNTRVMTREGLKEFSDLSEDQQIMTMDKETERIEYQKPSKIHEYDYSGDMVRFSGQMYDFLVTPNHQMLVETNSSGEVETVTAEELVNGRRSVYDEALELSEDIDNFAEIGRILGVNKSTVRNWVKNGAKPTLSHKNRNFLKTGEWTGECVQEFELNQITDTELNPVAMEYWLDFLGRWISEGSLNRTKGEKGDYVVSIRNNDEQFLDKASEVLESIGLNPDVRYDHGSLSVSNKSLYRYLEKFGHAEEKYIPRRFKDLTVEKLESLLNALIDGDGSTRYNGFRYSTVSEKLAHDVAEIAIKLGYGASISVEIRESDSRSDIYRVGLAGTNTRPRITKSPEILENYYGTVYDVTVPNGVLMIERNGKLTWSGNSYDGGKEVDQKYGVGTLAGYVPIESKNNKIDFAWYDLKEDRIANSFVLGMGVPKEVAEVSEGDRVFKGNTRTTSYREGEVLSTDATVRVNFSDGVKEFDDQILTTSISKGGDSGSTIFDKKGRDVGTLFGGSSRVSVINKIDNILEETPLYLNPEEVYND